MVSRRHTGHVPSPERPHPIELAFTVFVAALGLALLAGVTALSGSQRDVIVSYGGLALSALAAVGALVSVLLKVFRDPSGINSQPARMGGRSVALLTVSVVGLASAALATLLVWGALQSESHPDDAPPSPTAPPQQGSPSPSIEASASPDQTPRTSSSSRPTVEERPTSNAPAPNGSLQTPVPKPTEVKSTDVATTAPSRVEMWAEPNPASIANGGYIYFYANGLSDAEHVRLEVVAPPGKGGFCSGVTPRCNLWLVMESFDFDKSTWQELRVSGEDQFNIAMPLDGNTPIGLYTMHVDLVDRGTTITSDLLVNP